jgi:hypothetical protein
MTDEMNDAGLNDGLRKDGGDRLGKALQSVDNGNQKVLMPRFFSAFMTRSQNLAPSVFSCPVAQNILRPIPLDAERDVDRLVAHQALVPDFDPQRIEEDKRIARLQRTVLPFDDRLQNRVRPSAASPSR